MQTWEGTRMNSNLRQTATATGQGVGRAECRRRGAARALLLAVSLTAGGASAATLGVDDAIDPGIPDDGRCSLREAVAAINIGADDADDCTHAGAAYGQDDRIAFASALDGSPILLDGQMQIDVPLEITGNGAQATVLDAQQLDRIFLVPPTAGDFTLRGLTLRNGRTGGAGGAIRYAPAGVLTVEDCVLSVNSTFGGGAPGGAIYAEAGEVVVRRSFFDGNATSGLQGFGGAIRAAGAPLTIEYSTLVGNSTIGVQGHGGAIRTTSGPVTVIGSTLAGNFTAGTNADGGAISTDTAPVILVDSTLHDNATLGDAEAKGGAVSAFAQKTTRLIVTNSTLSANSGFGDGGAAYVGGDVTLTNSTVVGNQSGAGVGGGIRTVAGALTALNAIVALNQDSGGANDLSIAGTLTLGHSLVGTNAGTDLVEAPLGTPDANGNLIGGPDNGAIDPQLESLAANGGPTDTHALGAGSPAIDAGDDAVCAADPVGHLDQRGHVRPWDGDGDGGAACDIGSHEQSAPSNLVFADGFEGP